MAEIISLFSFIFLAALPGRTTFLLILLSTKGNRQKIFIGAALAFLVQALVSILMGEVFSFFPFKIIEALSGLLFIYFSWQYFLESKKDIHELDSNISNSVKSVFILVFMAELGDVSQLAIAAAANRASSKVLVFFVAIAVMWLITILALLFGKHIGYFLKQKFLQRAAAIIFFVLGIFLISKYIFHNSL